MKRYVNNISKLKNSISVKTDVHFVSKVSASQDFEPMLSVLWREDRHNHGCDNMLICTRNQFSYC